MSARPVSCLAKAVKSDETIEYSPDINDVMKWHKIFNKEIFKNRCPKFNSSLRPSFEPYLCFPSHVSLDCLSLLQLLPFS